MRKAGTIEEVQLGVGSLTANGDGLFSVHTQSINGTIQSITLGSSIHANTGSYLFFVSGTNSAVGNDLILRIRAGSYMQSFYPRTYTHDNQLAIGSGTSDSARERFVLNSPIRVVGSGLGADTSGLYINIKYI